jgi:hypothetical protein
VGTFERLALAGSPDISERAVRAELTWSGTDRALDLLGALLFEAVDAIELDPAPAWRVYIHLDDPESGWRPDAEFVRANPGALLIGIGREPAGDAMGSLAVLADGGGGHRSAEVPARFRRDGQEHDGVLTLLGPTGSRPARAPLGTASGTEELIHPALHVQALWSRGESLNATLGWADVYSWVERLLGDDASGSCSSVVDQQLRHFTLELSRDLRPTQIASTDGQTTCVLSPSDAAKLLAFLQAGLRRETFPVGHEDFELASGGYLTIVVPFDR